MLLTAHSPRDYQIASRYLRSGHVDGALLVSMHGKRPLDLRSLGVPVVLACRSFGQDDGISDVDADNAGGARMAVQYLLKLGREMVATIAGPPDMAPGADRLSGYKAAMAEAELSDPSLIVFGDFGRVSAEHGLYRLLDRRPRIDAVFAASDLMAAGVLSALRRAGRRVPDDVAVIGFEDSPLAQHTEQETDHGSPAGRGHRRPDGQRTARPHRPGGQQPTQVILDTELVIRDSA